MKNYLICYYILRQCLFETLEDDLAKLLGEISPELWEEGNTEENRIYRKWSGVIDTGTMSGEEIRSSLIEALAGTGKTMTKTIAHLRDADMEYYLSSAEEQAENLMNEWRV